MFVPKSDGRERSRPRLQLLAGAIGVDKEGALPSAYPRGTSSCRSVESGQDQNTSSYGVELCPGSCDSSSCSNRWVNEIRDFRASSPLVGRGHSAKWSKRDVVLD